MSDKANTELTEHELDLLEEYLEASSILFRSIPKPITGDDLDIIQAAYDKTGEIPDEYKGRIGLKDIVVHNVLDKTIIDEDGKARGIHKYVPEGKTIKGFYDIELEALYEKRNQLESKYHDVLEKAIKFVIKQASQFSNTTDVGELLKELLKQYGVITQDQARAALLKSTYLPMLNGAPTNELMQITTKGITPDLFTKTATIITKDGHKISIENFDKLQGVLSTPARKLLDTATLYLTSNNFYRGNPNSIAPTVEIPLIEYGEACGYKLTADKKATPEEQTAENKRVQERIKELRKNIRRDLHDLSSVLWTGEETRGKNKGSYVEMRIISSHSISNGLIRINFDVDAAKYLVNAYVMQYPTVLLKLDNRNPNAYALGRKIAFHNSNDNNNAAGTNNTLSVISLLAAMTDIPTIDELKSRKQRNWKDKIKKPLESCLDANINIGYLKKWEYRDPKTGKRYDAEKAQPLEWEVYSKLMVDFITNEQPEQTERRTAKAAKAAELKETEDKKEAPPKKKGRPKKKQTV